MGSYLDLQSFYKESQLDCWVDFSIASRKAVCMFVGGDSSCSHSLVSLEHLVFKVKFLVLVLRGTDSRIIISSRSMYKT